jgi:hypothetical protein
MINLRDVEIWNKWREPSLVADEKELTPCEFFRLVFDNGYCAG